MQIPLWSRQGLCGPQSETSRSADISEQTEARTGLSPQTFNKNKTEVLTKTYHQMAALRRQSDHKLSQIIDTVIRANYKRGVTRAVG